MQITNNIPEDITFELDVNKSPVKGMQSRVTISGRSYGEVGIEQVMQLAMDKGFQAQVMVNNITLVKPYTAWGGGTGRNPVAPVVAAQAKAAAPLPADAVYVANILSFLNGTF